MNDSEALQAIKDVTGAHSWLLEISNKRTHDVSIYARDYSANYGPGTTVTVKKGQGTKLCIQQSEAIYLIFAQAKPYVVREYVPGRLYVVVLDTLN